MIRFRFVQDNQADLSISRMCALVEVPRSSFYAWVNHSPSARDLADEALLETIRGIYRRSRNTYGVPRVYGQLRRTGHRVARSRVARLMSANNLIGAHASKKWRRGRPDAGIPHTTPTCSHPTAPESCSSTPRSTHGSSGHSSSRPTNHPHPSSFGAPSPPSTESSPTMPTTRALAPPRETCRDVQQHRDREALAADQ